MILLEFSKGKNKSNQDTDPGYSADLDREKSLDPDPQHCIRPQPLRY